MLVLAGKMHHRQQPLRIALAENRREDILVRVGAGTAAQLEEVVFPLEGELARRLLAQEQFVGQAALHLLVPEAVADPAADTVHLAEILARPHARLQVHALQVVETDDFGIRADPDGTDFPIAVDNRIDDGIEVLVERHVLHLLHHLVDVFLLVRQFIGAHVVPIGLVLVIGFPFHLDRPVGAGIGHFRRKIRIRIIQLTHADEGHHLGRIAQGDGKIGVHLVVLVEPGGILEAGVFRVDDDVPQPVHVPAPHHLRVNGAQRKIPRVHEHFPVEGGRRNAPLGVIADLVGLPGVHLQGVDDVIIIEEQAPRLDGRGKFHVEGIDERIVEIDLQVHTAGELRQQVRVRIDAGNPVGDNLLPVHLGIAGVAAPRHRLGNHHRQVRHAGNRRCVHIIEHEAEFLLEALALEPFLGPRQVQFYFIIDVAGIARPHLRIVPVTVGLDARQQALDFAVVRLHDDAFDLVVGGHQVEIHLGKAAGAHRHLLADIAQQLAAQHPGRLVARLQVVFSVVVARQADGGVLEKDRRKGNRLPRLRILDDAAHLGRLRRRRKTAQKNQHQYE